MDDVTRLLSDLVAIPSVNPMGRPMSGPEVLEGRMTDYLERFFQSLGVPYERRTVLPGRDNILARYEAPTKGRLLIFDAHQDTVPTDGMVIPPFEPRIDGNRLYGRGSNDIKGGMAAMLTAFARLVRERPRGSASVIMACTVDEELTHKGSSALAEYRLGADLAIVTEPTNLEIVNCHKGAVRWKIRTKGVACHSSRPELGDNAIYRMGAVVSTLGDYAGMLSKAKPDPVLGLPTLSVGRIEGGQSVNVVPDWCMIEVDRRMIPGEVASDAINDLRHVLQDRLGAKAMDAVEFEPPWINFPALSPRGTEPFLATIQQAAAPVLGRTPSIGGVPYGTDAGPLGSSGMPCVVLGPGDIAQAHTKDEWADLEQVRQAVEVYYRVACALG